MNIQNYQVVETLYSGNNSTVYVAKNPENKSVIVKLCKTDNLSPLDIQKIHYEYAIIDKLKSVHTPKAYELLRVGTEHAIIMELVEGNTLHQEMKKGLDLGKRLKIALAICEALQDIHKENIIHKDLNPANILYNEQQERASIIDFGISTQLSREIPTIQGLDSFEGTLYYISPEQTGRMNRPIDYRSDYYSLGVTFYELFTEKLPFSQKDLLEIVHAHIALSPVAPHEIENSLPTVISEIILKLMSKNAEDRYQSLYGLKEDLKACLEHLDDAIFLENFVIAQKDSIGKFQIPSKLYGRENEAKEIIEAYFTVSQGHTALITVAGFSGIGKSALVNEVHKPLSKDKGYFVSGKYDQFQRNIPYSSIIQAFRELIRQILTESEEKIAVWRKKIQKALGENGEVITNIIPELENIIGKQMPLAMLGAAENRNRFLYVFQNFTSVFAQPEHPLVIFLDDLQWADSSSLELIKSLLAQQGRALLFIIAYRDNEVDASHPLTAMLQNVETLGIDFRQIVLKNLPIYTTAQILSDTLHTKQIDDLNQLVYERTSGNPFFLNEFLNFLYKEYFLNFDEKQGCWVWDIHKITQAKLTNNVVTLMVSKLKKLSHSAQFVLQYASCIGNQFDLKTLQVICPQENILEGVWEALKEGVIIPLNNNYKYVNTDGSNWHQIQFRFLHDRVQQAAFALIDEHKQNEIHVQIGLLLKNSLASEQQKEEIFELLNHLNYGVGLISEKDFRFELAQMNLLAAQKANASAAYTSCIVYLETGLKFLPDNVWQEQYNLMLSFQNLYVSAHLLDGKPAQAIELADQALAHIPDILDAAPIIMTKIEAFAALSEFVKAVDLACDILLKLGVDFNPNPEMEDVGAELGKTLEIFGHTKISDFENLPIISDPKMATALMIIPNIFLPSYVSRPMLFLVLNCKNIQIMSKYGNTPICSFLYSMYAQVHWALLGTNGISAALEFGKISLRLYEKMGVKAVGCGVYEQVAIAMNFYETSFRTSIDSFEKSVNLGFETGQIIFTNLSYMHRCNLMFYDGVNIEKTVQTAASCMQWKRKTGIPDFTMTIGLLHSMNRLANFSSEYAEQVVQEVDLEPMIATMYDIKNYSEAMLCNFANAFSHYYLNEYEQAQEQILLIEPMMPSLGGTFYHCVVRIYTALIHLSVFDTKNQEEQADIIAKVENILEELNYWLTCSTLSFGAYHQLVLGELERVKGNNPLDFYDQAIIFAEQAKQTNLEALANELAGVYFSFKNKDKIARAYLQDAYKLYMIWGADKKANLLKEDFMLGSQERRQNITQTIRGTSKNTMTAALDFASLMKAANAITSELSLNSLLKSIMHVMIENSGASQGVLILSKDKEFFIKAFGNSNGEQILDTPLKNSELVPHSIINLVLRTKKELVLDNALSSAYETDTYVVKNATQSLLCFPIINKQELVGAIYLENKNSKGVFSTERLEVLKMLSSQAATSIENALLYASLEDKVKERTHELNEAYNDIRASINYAQRIQTAILPNEEKIKEVLPDYFAVFMPRDVVSGDFYWFAHKKEADYDKIIISVADCTGHGVPGAFMSMVGNSTLGQIVHDAEIHEPDQILNQMHLGIRKALRQDSTDNKDGMDMVICVIDLKAKTLHFAGANNPLLYIQNNEVQTIKGTKLGIGGENSHNEHIFQKHSIDVSIPSVVYLFSDGYQDQFGGKDKRKFMISRMREMFLTIHQQDVNEQKSIIEKTISLWKEQGKEKQTDDITVLGFKLNL